jgi:hypothetical protein
MVHIVFYKCHDEKSLQVADHSRIRIYVRVERYACVPHDLSYCAMYNTLQHFNRVVDLR